MYAWKAAAQIPAMGGWHTARGHHDNHYSCKPTARIPKRPTAKSKEGRDIQEEGRVHSSLAFPTPHPLFFIHLDFIRPSPLLAQPKPHDKDSILSTSSPPPRLPPTPQRRASCRSEVSNQYAKQPLYHCVRWWDLTTVRRLVLGLGLRHYVTREVLSGQTR